MRRADETPWLLERVVSFVRRYVHMSDEQALAVSLWVLYTWVCDAFDVAPYLDVSSPVRECGKTRLFECLELVCKSPRRCTGHTEATLFRMVEAEHPTMLMDEIDATFGRDPKLYAGIRGVLDEGHRRGGSVPRMVGEGNRMRLRYFDVFGPKAFAGIGALPETVATRSVPIRLERKPRTERVERFRPRRAKAGTEELRVALAEWSRGVQEGLSEAEPLLPDELSDRQWDIWEPLIAIADLADVGGAARKAAVGLHGGSLGQVSAGQLALGHMRELFVGHDRLPTREVLKGLVARDDGPWGDWWGADVDVGHTKGPASRLAKLLRDFGIAPEEVWIDGAKERGYKREKLEPAWDRYLPPGMPPTDGRTVGAGRETPPDQRATDLPSTRGPTGARPRERTAGGTVGDVVARCPACGAHSAAKGYQGHMNGCPYFYGRVIGSGGEAV